MQVSSAEGKSDGTHNCTRIANEGRRLQMLNEKIDRINKKTMCNSVGHYAWKDALTRAEAAALEHVEGLKENLSSISVLVRDVPWLRSGKSAKTIQGWIMFARW